MNEKIFFGVPCGDRRIDVDCMLAIMRQVTLNTFSQTYFHMGISEVALARNIVAHRFLHQSNCDWFMMIDSDIIFSQDDWNYLWEDDGKLIVIAPYARKIPGASPATFGLGFTRVHRSVFEKIDALETEDGRELAQRFYLDGQVHVNYYPNGVTGDSRWLGEDRAFFTLCAMTGTEYRMEERCRLEHVGHFKYGYPMQSGLVDFWVPENIRGIKKGPPKH